MKSVILTEYCWFQFWCVFKCGKKKNPKTSRRECVQSMSSSFSQYNSEEYFLSTK